MATVTVTGSARATIAPDRARLDATLTDLRRDPADALGRTSDRVHALEALLRDAGVADDCWTTTGVSVAEEREWRQDHHELVGYRATATVQITVTDIDQLGRLLGRIVADTGGQVQGPWWQVDDDNPALLALLGDAARDARRRAEAYASALGLSLGAVDAVSERPFHDGPPRPMPEMGMLRAAKMDAAESVPVHAGPVELRAEVHVRFALLA